MAKTPAWQRKAGKNPEGGLNAAGRASYNRETGGSLKPPVKSGDNPRRASFLARMGSMPGPEKDEISTCAKRLANVGSIDEYVSPNASLNSARTSSDVLYPLANSSEYSRSMSSLEQMCLTCGHTVRMCKPKHMLAFMERAYPCIVTQIFKTVGRVLAPSVCKLLLGGD